MFRRSHPAIEFTLKVKMDKYPTQLETHIWLSLLGIVLAMVIFITIWLIGGTLFNLFDSMRGLGNDKLQVVFREVVVPGMGGYLSMSAVESWVKRANTRFVFFALQQSSSFLRVPTSGLSVQLQAR